MVIGTTVRPAVAYTSHFASKSGGIEWSMTTGHLMVSFVPRYLKNVVLPMEAYAAA